jgi:hypothetical protein
MQFSPARIRIGSVALAIVGALFLAYPAVRPWHDENTVSGATTSMGSQTWVAAHFFAMLGFILLPLGLLAVRAAVAASRSERTALIATVITWIGAGLVLPYYGAEDFALHAIAGPKGHGANLLDLAEAVRYQPLAVTIFGVGLVLLAIGAIVLAVAVWRSGVVAKAGGVLFAAGFALFLPQFYAPAAFRIAHGVLMAVGFIVLATVTWNSIRTPAVADADRAVATVKQ